MPSSYAPHVGGVEEVTRRLAAGLRAQGHSPTVITNRWPNSLPRADTIDALPVERHAFRVAHRSVRGLGGWLLYSRPTRRAVIASARAHRCDVVNVHCVSSNAGYALAAAQALSMPLVVSVHGELSGDAAQAYARSGSLRRMLRTLLARAAGVTAPSDYALTELEQFYGRPLPGARVIRNGVDLELFGGARPVAARRFVLAAGRLVRNKGFDLLIDAWASLPAHAADVALVIAGDGPDLARLEGMAAASPAADRIEFVGRLSREDLASTMRAATAFVLASRAEAFPLVVLEAMAAGTPVVASAVGGVPEIVRDGDTGLLVPAGDAAALTDALVHVLTDEAAASRRAAAASAAVAGMTWQACTEQFVAAYAAAGAGR